MQGRFTFAILQIWIGTQLELLRNTDIVISIRLQHEWSSQSEVGAVDVLNISLYAFF